MGILPPARIGIPPDTPSQRHSRQAIQKSLAAPDRSAQAGRSWHNAGTLATRSTCTRQLAGILGVPPSGYRPDGAPRPHVNSAHLGHRRCAWALDIFGGFPPEPVPLFFLFDVQ
tara:strand:+ start:5403 stop:5744 length:342 start_codon:yes stop_codon:yes gene_type:complete